MFKVLWIQLFNLSLPLYTNNPSSFAIGIIDAGSTGTRLEYFSVVKVAKCYKDDEVEPIEYSNPAFMKRFVVGAVQDSNNLEKYLGALFNKTSKRNKLDQIYFKGTAGLRNLTLEKQTSILKQTKSVLKKLVNTDFKHIKTEIISGKMEGVFVWYSLIKLLKRKDMKINIISLGGSSLQIIEDKRTIQKFFVENKKIQFEDYYFNQKKFYLYSRSFDHLGLKDIKETYHHNVTNIDGSCLHKEKKYNLGKNFVIGISNFTKCVENTKYLIDLLCHKDSPDCEIFNQHKISRTNQKASHTDDDNRYYITDGIAKLAALFKIGTGPTSLKELYMKCFTFCNSRSYENRITHKTFDFKGFECFYCAYVYNLLKMGLKFGLYQNFYFVNYLNNYNIDWALGAAYYETNLNNALGKCCLL